MADIRCLICNRMNDASAERCWYCNTLLPRQGGSLTPQEREKLAGLRNQADSPESKVTPNPPEDVSQTAQPESTSEEIPDWLVRVRQLKQQDTQSEKTEPHDWVAEEQPEWLRDLAAGPVIRASSAISADEDESPMVNTGPVEGSEAQFNELNKASFEQGEEDQKNAEPPPFKGDIFSDTTPAEEFAPDITPDWSFLSTGHEEREPEIDAGEVEEREEVAHIEESETGAGFPIPIEDLPEWLADDQTIGDEVEKPISEEGPNEPAPENKLEKAHLPAWLASLRPIQSIIQGAPAPEPQPETTDHGILAGIQGTLPTVEPASQVKEPRTFGPEFHLSPAQRRNADLFRLLLEPGDENPSTGVERPVGTKDNKIIRLVVTLLVLLSVLLPLFSSAFRAVNPQLYPTELVDMLGIVQSLPGDKPVLVIAHFEAGLAGELDWTAQPVLRHLISRGVPMALTSTNVVGFALLQEMVRDAVRDGEQYSIDDKVVELGYLPGGTIGLGALVQDPLVALPFTTDIQPVGEVKVLQGINALTDFGAMILVTDNPDVARSLIEQIGQSSTPINTLAVLSAQAAPLVQPYYASGQVDGMVSGVGGAMAYELLRAVPGGATTRFPIYQFALLSAAVIILVGGIVFWMVGSPTTRAKEGKR